MKQVLPFLYLFFLYSCAKDLPLGTKEEITCSTNAPQNDTLVILVMGQSNAANAGSVLFQSPCSNTKNFYQGTFYPLHDPLKGANGEGGSVWSRLGYKLVESNFAEQVIIAPVAIGGTSIEQWIPGGNLNYLINETLQDLALAQLEIDYVLWHQGESNNTILNPSISPQQNALNYSANFLLLVDYLRSRGVASPIFLATATRCASLLIDPDLQAAQQNLASDSLGIYRGPNTDILGSAYRYDDCHFNAQGLDAHALLWLDVLLQH